MRTNVQIENTSEPKNVKKIKTIAVTLLVKIKLFITSNSETKLTVPGNPILANDNTMKIIPKVVYKRNPE